MTIRYMPLEVSAAPPLVLDIASLKRGFFFVAVALMVVAPFSQDPLAMSVGAAVPWLLLQLVNRPGVPAGVVYILLYQWLQVFARVLQSMVDGEPMSASLVGPNVGRAYWYMMASLVAMALALRFTLGNLGDSRDRAHFEWRPNDIFALYLLMLIVAVVCRFVASAIPGLDQPVDMLAKMKIVLLFMMFTTVLTTGRSANLMWVAVGIEIVMGFTGILSDFRAVFIYLAIAAIASRIPVRGSSLVGAAICAGALMILALFWTAVKMEYRAYVTGGTGTQAIQVDVEDRLGYLGSRVVDVDQIDWGKAAYMLLARLAYTDIFGSVITVQESQAEPEVMRQWQDAIDHVARPRVLFPGKASLSDTDVYVRLARGDASDEVIRGTSISVGYMAENFADLGFPGMLVGCFLVGVLVGLAIRYFMTRKLPWIVREGVVVALAVSVFLNGVETSLPKLLGSAFMFFVVYALLARFAFPMGLRWLKGRSAVGQPQLP